MDILKILYNSDNYFFLFSCTYNVIIWEGSEQFSSRNFYLVNHNAYFLDDGKNSATLLLDRGERSEMRDYKLIPSNDSY